MSLKKIKRRDFLKIMGWSGAGATLAGCDLPTTVTLEEGGEEVVSYLAPEEYVIPGIGVWYATACQQCGAGCSIHGRVREGRVLKLEGNPDSAVNAGRLCQMGQAGLQNHYNPDRITTPLARSGGGMKEISWDEALEMVASKSGGDNRSAWVTGSVSGHQAVLLDAYLNATGGEHYPVEMVNNAVWQRVCDDMLGDANPRLRVDKAQAIVSFGADFLGASPSPVHFAKQYADFRSSPRGVLVQIEPNMTLTGANADKWIAIRPGTEGAFALGVANVLINRYGVKADKLPATVRNQISEYGPDRVKDETGVSVDQLMRVARLLKERSPSLVLAGVSASGHGHGYRAAAAAMLLNILLGNVDRTITANARVPQQLAVKYGNTANLFNFADAAGEGRFDTVFFYGSNPVYLAPDSLGLKEKIAKIPFKVALSSFRDETTMQADLILPLASALEDWGTHVGNYQDGKVQITVQQPLMEKLYPETRGFGDVMLTLLKQRKVGEYAGFEDYYAYLRNAIAAMPQALNSSGGDAWSAALQKGVIDLNSGRAALDLKAVSIELPGPDEDASYPLHLVPTARLSLWDGRHANLPWLQEAPDQISKVVWDSWVEMHPDTAARLGVKRGDRVRIASRDGAIEAKVYTYKGIHRDVVAVPIGQGHDEDFSRYAKDRGTNPLTIVGSVQDQKTGELALQATRVKVSAANEAAEDRLVIMGGSETQMGRKLVATVTADVFERTEGEA